MPDDYILLYGPKKTEDNLFATNMFINTHFIPIGWTKKNVEIIKQTIKKELKPNIKQVIFWGLEDGWDKVITELKKENTQLKIKVICNTTDSLLYYDYERKNFFTLLELEKDKIVDVIGFLKKSMYEVYNKLGYNCMYLLENIILNDNTTRTSNDNRINIGIYPLNYTWDKNIFNQLSVGKFIDNSIINYNPLDEKMEDFINTMKIEAKKDSLKPLNIDLTSERIDPVNCEEIANIIAKNDVNISCDFTDYVHAIYFLSMERGIPCIIGNNSNLYDDNIVVNSEDNPIEIGERIKYAKDNKETIIENYQKWKHQYNEFSKKSVQEFINA